MGSLATGDLKLCLKNSELFHCRRRKVRHHFRSALPGGASSGLHVTHQGTELLCTRHHSHPATFELEPEPAGPPEVPERIHASSTGRLRPGLGVVPEAFW